MQRRWLWATVGLFLTGSVSVLAQQAQIGVEFLYPHYAARGQATVINIAVPSPEKVLSAEIAPANGVTISDIKGSGSGSEQNVGWWEVTLVIATDAAPGDRALVLVLPGGRTRPIPISVSTHAPAISDLRIAPQANQSTVELQFAAADAGGDLGDSPYIWFMADCGGDPIAGALRGKVAGGIVRTGLPNVRKAAKDGLPPAGRCDLQVRLTDSTGIDSNTLTATVDFKE